MVPGVNDSDPAALAANVGLVLPAALLTELRAQYADPPRVYHDWSHVQAVLPHYRAVQRHPGWRQPREVLLAVLYHDAVYRAGRSDNESRSAQQARQAIARHLPDAGVDAERVAILIERTAEHGSLAQSRVDADPAADDLRHFLDCDMAILGASAAEFDAYHRGIAAEYAGVVPSPLFRWRRRRFLQALLDSPRIYLSELFHVQLDAAARANLRRAVDGRIADA